MKSIKTTIILICIAISLQGQGFEGMIGLFESNAGYDSENNVRSEKMGGQAGIHWMNHYEGVFYASTLASIKTNGDLSSTSLVHFNFLWFFEPLSEIFVGNEKGENISLLVGSGLMFSNMFHSNLDLPADMRLNVKFQKFRMQVGIQRYLLERSNYEQNTEFYIRMFHSFIDGTNKGKSSKKTYVNF